MKIFSSGSCRLLTTINNGYNVVIPIHSMYWNFVGVNFLGKLHNSKQHIQFIKFIKNIITLQDDILPKFLTSYNTNTCGCVCENLLLLPSKKENIKSQFDDCEWYIFEICSLKLYKNNGFEVQIELTNDHECLIQTKEELLEDLHTIRTLIPINKKILLQIHFRPNIINNDPLHRIENREIIYDVVSNFCEQNNNTFLYDPSILIQTNHLLFDGDSHFTSAGHIESFFYIYNNYILKFA